MASTLALNNKLIHSNLVGKGKGRNLARTDVAVHDEKKRTLYPLRLSSILTQYTLDEEAPA